jgi:hypothetical protein
VFLKVVFGSVPALPGPGEEVYREQFAISGGGVVLITLHGTSTHASKNLPDMRA